MKKTLRINSQKKLRELAQRLGVRHDWHEPDNQDVEAICFGEKFDNAGFWGREYRDELTRLKFRGTEEMSVMLVKDGKPIAEINLASLFAMACGTWKDDDLER